MSYREETVPHWFKMYASKLVIATIAIALAVCAWANLLFHVNIDANAETLSSIHLAVTAEGIGDKVEGKVEKDIGTVQRNLGKVSGQTEGALKQTKGKAKEDIGTVKNKLDEAGDKTEDASESFIDSVKDFFN
jgi:uncharacterized protein YjbJ (UPF0337 family)